MAKSDLCIDILGTSISISTDEDAEYLDTLLEKYRQIIENVKQKSGLKDPLKIAVLTGFLLCDDMEKAGPAVSPEDAEAEQLALGIISRLDELVEETSHSSASLHEELQSSIFKLQNTVKHYEWGSAEWIPALMGQKNLSRIPWAELWMGVHPAGPSRIVDCEETETGEGPPGEHRGEDPSGLLLAELIEKDPLALLGPECHESFGKLPFLFKVLAAAKPLSIQVHPKQEQAWEGFDRETREGIPLDSPKRNYRDSNHKPEIICALSPFAALCGFRAPDEIRFFLEILRDCPHDIDQNGEVTLASIIRKDNFEKLIFALKQEDENPLKAFISILFNLEGETWGSFIKSHESILENDFPEYLDEWKLCSHLAGLPGIKDEDPGLLAPLYLNIIELAPGEAMYLPAGVFHAYIHGLGIELMADSDNVLRAGLTAKHIDPQELLKILNFSPFKPEIWETPTPSQELYSYPGLFKEFILSVIQGQGGQIPYTLEGPSIVIVYKGSALLEEAPGVTMNLNAGESVFIPAGKKPLFSGDFTAYAASVPGTATEAQASEA